MNLFIFSVSGVTSYHSELFLPKLKSMFPLEILKYAVTNIYFTKYLLFSRMILEIVLIVEIIIIILSLTTHI